MNQDQLLALVDNYSTGDWESELDITSERREYLKVYEDPDVEVYAIWWPEGAQTGFHDHGDSNGAVIVVRGSILHSYLTEEHGAIVDIVEMTQFFSFEGGYIHDVRSIDGDGAITVHAYSPPISAYSVGIYEADEKGALHRVVISGDEELSPHAFGE